jgi:hypothetical protein
MRASKTESRDLRARIPDARIIHVEGSIVCVNRRDRNGRGIERALLEGAPALLAEAGGHRTSQPAKPDYRAGMFMRAADIMNNHRSAIRSRAKSKMRPRAQCVQLFQSHHRRNLMGAGA